MRISRPLLLLFFCSLIPASLSAQQSASAPVQDGLRTAQAASIIQQSVTAMTGGAPIADVTMTGAVTVNKGSSTESGTIALVSTAAGQSRVTFVLPSGAWSTTQNYATNPRTSTQVGLGGTIQDTAPEDLMGPHPAWFCPALLFGAISPQAYSVSYIDQETRDGSTVQHLSVWPQSTAVSLPISFVAPGQQVLTGPGPSPPPHIGQQELFIDPSSLLPRELIIRIRGYRPVNSSDPKNATIPILVDQHVQFSDYRQVQGRTVAFHIQVFFELIPAIDVQLSSISFNTGVTIAVN